MDGRFKEKSWEFWVGAGFVGIAVVILLPALLFGKWREVVSDLGPSVAAFAVVGAAFIAYAGAIAKVRFDYAEASGAKAALRKSALLRLELACYELDVSIGRMIPNLMFEEINEILVPTFIPQHFRVIEPEGIAMAWGNLELLPAEIASELRDIRIAVGETKRLLDGLEKYPYADGTKIHKGALAKQLTSARDAARVIKELIQPEIDEFTPQLSYSDRMEKMFGSPQT